MGHKFSIGESEDILIESSIYPNLNSEVIVLWKILPELEIVPIKTTDEGIDVLLEGDIKTNTKRGKR